jgi:hypothetical protein
MGREKRARLKRWSKNSRRTCRCWDHHESYYPRRSKMLQQTIDAILTTTAKESAWSCEWMHDMAIMMQCNLSKLSGIGILTHTYMVQVVLLRDNLKCWLVWQRQGMGELLKIKWSGVSIFGKSLITPYLIIMWDANYHGTTWCEMQMDTWMAYSDSTHSSEEFSYKTLFISSYGLEDMNLARFNICSNF